MVTGGTDNHLILIDLRNLTLSGKDAEHMLDKIGITVNKNAIPFDPTSPFVTSGIRIGTPAVTSRGMNEEDMRIIAQIIAMTLKNPINEKIHQEARMMVKDLTSRYPLYEDIIYE